MIRVVKMYKKYTSGKQTRIINNNITISVKKGEFALLIGESGAGKSTLLNIISGLEKPDRGRVIINSKPIETYNEKELADFRRENLGFVFQFYNLIPNLTVEENIELVAKMSKNSFEIRDVLKMVGLKDKASSFPNQLSGGEQQRVSIARAIVKKPKILLCDEPTGALDKKTGKEILRLLQDLSLKRQMTVVMVTHSRSFMPMANRVFEITDGKISRKLCNIQPKKVKMLKW